MGLDDFEDITSTPITIATDTTSGAFQVPVSGFDTPDQTGDANPNLQKGYIRVGRGALATVRQTVLTGNVDGSGYANFLGIGTGLAVSLNADPTHLVVAFADGYNAYGNNDYIASIEDDAAAAWSALTANTTCYLYIDYDSVTSVLSYGFSVLAPLYQFMAPDTPATDQHWFDLSTMKMKRYTGTVWEEKKRVFAGEAVTHADHVDSVTAYALLGKYTSVEAAVAEDTLYDVSHNLGMVPGVYSIWMRNIDTDRGYVLNDYICYSPWVNRLVAGYQFIEAPWVNHKTSAGAALGQIDLTKWKWRIDTLRGW